MDMNDALEKWWANVPDVIKVEKVHHEMEHFMNSETFSDIKVKVGDEVFNCHKIILASCSLYFNALFKSGMNEMKHGMVELTAIEKEDFQKILKVMYTGKCDIDRAKMHGLMYSASYLQILPLLESCERFIKRILYKEDLTRVLHYLQISHQLNLNSLAKYIINYIARKFKTYDDIDKLLESLSFDDMKIFLVSEKHCLKSEDEICSAMLSWIDVDCGARQRYARDLVKKIHYLALSNDYMTNTFLEHKAIKDNDSCKEIRNNCLEYLSASTRQSDYIGEPNASQRNGHQHRDVIAVFFQNCVKLLKCIEKEDGSLEFTHSLDMNNHWPDNLRRPKDLNEKGITACNYGRSEVMLSNGIRLLHFNGLTWVWTSGPKHIIQSNINCIICHESSGDIYNVVVASDSVFIEKCRFDHGKGFGDWEIEIQKDIESSSEIIETIFERRDRTCAYMLGKNIFFIKAGVAPKPECATVFKYNTTSKGLGVVNILPLKYKCATAVTHKGLVFLVDDKGQTILRISEEGHCFEKFGEIGMDFHDMDDHFSNYSGACIFKGNLIRVNDLETGAYESDTAHVISYDLCQHVTNVHSFNTVIYDKKAIKNGVCLKLTMMPLSDFPDS